MVNVHACYRMCVKKELRSWSAQIKNPCLMRAMQLDVEAATGKEPPLMQNALHTY